MNIQLNWNLRLLMTPFSTIEKNRSGFSFNRRICPNTYGMLDIHMYNDVYNLIYLLLKFICKQVYLFYLLSVCQMDTSEKYV